jgi:Spy/CpxP family protein refolding chaperone
MMRSNIIMLLFAFLLSLNFISLEAQNQNQNENQKRRMNIEEFEKRKVEYIRKEAGLTKSEADKFFPLNNELTKKKFELRKNHRDRVQKIKDSSDISEAVYRKLLEDDVEVKLKEAALDKEFAKKFEGVLTPEKLYKAQQSERDFMQKELSNFRSGQK